MFFGEMDKLIEKKLDDNEKQIFIRIDDDLIVIDGHKFEDTRSNNELIIDIALKYEHIIKAGQNIIVNDYIIHPIPDRQEIWDFFTDKDKVLCPCCVYSYITIFTFYVRYKMNTEKEYYLEDLLPLCKMCHTLLGDKSYKVFKEEYDRRYKANS